MDRLLENKVAVVSGGGQGLGVAIAMSLAVDGARIVVISRSEEKASRAVEAVQALGGTAAPYVADLREDGASEGAVAEAVKVFGGVDIVVNSAGYFLWKPFMELTFQEWQQVLDTNLTAAFRLSQEAARVMIDQKRGGSIVNIASIHGQFPDANVVAQCASKSGLIGLTRASAEALRPFDIRVNAVAPGSIEPDSPQLRGGSPQERVTQADVATLVVYLSSDFAKTVTGAVIEAYGSTRMVIKA